MASTEATRCATSDPAVNARNVSSGLSSATPGLLLAASLALAACPGEPLTTREEGNIGGAAVGGGTGALVGATVGARGAGAAIGGAAGGVAGYTIGNHIQNEPDRQRRLLARALPAAI